MADVSAQTQMRQREQLRAQKAAAAQNTATAHGSASFADPSKIDASGAIIMGRTEANKLLTYGGNGHCITFGPTGSGKGVSVVVPNLLAYPGSIVCIDPKGAIAPITAARRRIMGQKVVLLDPFGEVENAVNSRGQADAWRTITPASVNPFGHLDKNSLDAVDDARLIASSLITQENEKNRYFSDSARMVLEGLILYLLATRDAVLMEDLLPLAFKPREEFNSQTLADMKALGVPATEDEKVGYLESHIAHLAGLIENLTGDGGSAVWSTLYRSLNLVKSPRLLPSMRPSNVNFRDMKTTPTTVYLVLPAKHLETHGMWLRLMLSVLIAQLSDARRSDYPVLFIVDECAALGRLEILETAIGLMRGYGLKLWLIFQDLPQLKSVYAGRWESFISNSGVKQFFNVNDLVTADFVSQYLGNETLRVQSDSISGQNQTAGANIGAVGRALLTSDEVRRLPENEQILFYERKKPIRATKLCYYADADFRYEDGEKMFADDPYIIGNPSS
jgi:type IV secretion system protein VirD4